MPGMATICGEESAGTGSNHVREKDGLWAVLLWLNILAGAQARASTDIVREHWANMAATIIRATTMRKSDADAANALMEALRDQLPSAARASIGTRVTAPTILPMTIRSTARAPRSQGIRLLFADGSRIVYRLSGTGTAGATLRVYIERYEPDRQPPRHRNAGGAGRPHRAVARALPGSQARTGRTAPTVIT